MARRKTEQHMQRLARKWQESTISEEEKHRFDKWYHSFDDSVLEDESAETPEQLRERLYSAIVDKEKISSGRFRTGFRRKYLFAAAAVALLVLSMGGYFFMYRSPFQQTAQLKNKQTDIVPGGNKAVLTLADGSRIILDQAKNGVLASQDNITIRKDKDGQVIYQIKENRALTTDRPLRLTYHTISTPRGGQYQIDLPDGTKVWLNAASSLKFPAVFDGSERKVELTGEAYFEIAKMFRTKEKGLDKQQSERVPFIVTTRGQETEVLGTHFNINAYEDEEAVKTTLLEGVVKITEIIGNHKRGASCLLQPGQQARVADGIQVFNVNPDLSVAWKNGFFAFDDESLQSIMRKISRWYDADVAYLGNIQQRRFSGSISKFSHVSEVLKVMELTDVIHFKIEERRILVMP